MDINTLTTNMDNIKLEIEETLKMIEDENKSSEERKNEYRKRLEILNEKISEYEQTFNELKEKLNKNLSTLRETPKQIKKEESSRDENCCGVIFKTILISFMIPIGAIVLTEIISQTVNKL